MSDPAVAALRHFSRFYTSRLGLLDEGLLASGFSLTEVRVLYELAHHDGLVARELARTLGLDPGYLSRILRRFGARFVRRFDAQRERCWIAEQGGRIVGSVFVVRKSARTAQLRLLYVEPSARGQGLGARLVDECIRFARTKGYRVLTLWTNDVLDAARHIYESRGFVLGKQERHRSFGKSLVGQFWSLSL